MKNLALQLRVQQLYAHIGHNMITGATFFADHAHLGELYDAYESAYDSVVEHAIGVGKSIDLFELAKDAGAEVSIMSANWWSMLLGMEKELQGILDGLLSEAGQTEGTLNLLTQLYEDSENRCYKLQQRTR